MCNKVVGTLLYVFNNSNIYLKFENFIYLNISFYKLLGSIIYIKIRYVYIFYNKNSSNFNHSILISLLIKYYLTTINNF